MEIKKDEAITSFKILEENIFVKNGFFTETGLIENIAQTCSAITGQEITEDFEDHHDPGSKVIGFITNIKKVKIFDVPKVGDTIVSKAVLNSQFGEICTISCTTFLGEKVLVEAEISLFIKVI